MEIVANPVLQKVLNIIGAGTVVFILFMAVFMAVYSVKWVPNEHLINKTDPVTNVTTLVADLYYNRLDRVPIKQFGENDFNHWGMEQVFFGVAAILVFVFLLRRKDTFVGLKSVDEAKQKARDYLSKMKEVDKFKILAPSHLQMRAVNDGPSMPFSRQVFVDVDFNDKMEDHAGSKYLCLTFSPSTNELHDIIELEYEPTSKMKCPNCGIYPDLKVIDPEGLKLYRERFKDK